MFFDEPGIEAIVTGRYRGVGGEDDFPRNAGDGGVEANTLVIHPHVNGFQHCECAVAFIEVEDAGINAQRFQSAQSAYAEQQLLADSNAKVPTVQAGGKLAIFRSIALDIGVEQQQIATADFNAPHLSLDAAAASFNLDHHRTAIFADRDLHRQLVDIGLEIFLALPSVEIEALAEVALAIKQADTDQRNVEIGGAFDVISSQHPEAAGIDGQGFMQAEFSGKIGDRMGTEDTRVARAPGPVRLQILQHAAVGIVHPAVEHEFRRPGFQFGQRHLAQQGDRIMVQFTPAVRIEVEKKAGRVVIPTPPQVPRQGPQPLLQRCDETIEGASLAHHWSNLPGSLGEHSNFLRAENASFDRLHDQNTLQDAAIDQRHPQEGLVSVFSRVFEILKPRMVLDLTDSHRVHLLGDESGKSFMNCHAQPADALAPESNRGSEHQIGAVRFQQIGGTDIRVEPVGDEGHDVHQRLGRLTTVDRQVRNLFKCQNIMAFRAYRLIHISGYLISVQGLLLLLPASGVCRPVIDDVTLR